MNLPDHQLDYEPFQAFPNSQYHDVGVDLTRQVADSLQRFEEVVAIQPKRTAIVLDTYAVVSLTGTLFNAEFHLGSQVV